MSSRLPGEATAQPAARVVAQDALQGGARRTQGFPGRVLLISAAERFPTGQRTATVVVHALLRRMGGISRDLVLPAQGRDGILRYAWRLAGPLAQVVGALVAGRPDRVWLTLGQSWASFLREGILLLLAAVLHGRARVRVSLHSNLFLRWPPGSAIARTFAALLRCAGRISILGPGQVRHLRRLGVPSARLFDLPNSPGADASPLPPQPRPADGPVRVLFLGNLVEGKGHRRLLEALPVLAEDGGTPLAVTICGRHPGGPDAETAFGEEVAAVGRSLAAGRRPVRIAYVAGAYGVDKERLLAAADLLVLPSEYPVESQPIVIIEGFRHGCAVIASRAGEIAHLCDGGACARLLPLPVDAAILAAEIAALAADPAARAALAEAGRRRYAGQHSPAAHSARIRVFLRCGRVSLPAPPP